MEWVWILAALFSVSYGQDEGLPCVPRMFDQDSFVCVCNATYCDTLPRASAPVTGQFLLYTSDLTTNRFLKSLHDFEELKEGRNWVKVFFNLSSETFQTMIGWGGAITDSAAANILSLSRPTQDMLLRSYYSDEGIEYNIGRINMGGCDFSWRAYTCDDNEGDVSLDLFELQPEDLDYKIPIIKRATAMSEEGIKIFASPWSSPPWMKTNKDYIGKGQLLEEMYQPWAEYFVKFLDGYADNGVDIWGITAENEPSAGYKRFYPFNCLGFTAIEQTKFVAENLGPTLELNGYEDIVLMILDDNREYLPAWANIVLKDPVAQTYVDGIAVHWYTDNETDAKKLTQTHDVFPEYFMFGTEACTGFGGPYAENPVWLGAWERLESYAHDIIEDVNNWVAGWTDRNIALDMRGGPNWAHMSADAAVIVNPEKEEFYKNPMFYAMGHFSKFVKDDAVRLELTSDDSHGLETTAFRNKDGTRVIVILNRSETELEVRVQDQEQGTIVFDVGPRSLNTVFFS